MDFLNWRIAKEELALKSDEYSAAADWCNASGHYAIFEGKNEYYVAEVEIEVLPEETPEGGADVNV